MLQKEETKNLWDLNDFCSVQDKQGIREQLSQKKKTQLCKLLNGVIFINPTIIFSGGLCKHILCKISYSGQFEINDKMHFV